MQTQGMGLFFFFFFFFFFLSPRFCSKACHAGQKNLFIEAPTRRTETLSFSLNCYDDPTWADKVLTAHWPSSGQIHRKRHFRTNCLRHCRGFYRQCCYSAALSSRKNDNIVAVCCALRVIGLGTWN